ncbi:MAG: helix-turn-helix transcriptional regulator [Bacteroidota bacterium]
MKRKSDPLFDLGQRIKHIRTSKRITQQALAEKCDIETASISRIENGKINLTYTTLYKICDSLEISLAEMLLKNI